MKKKVFALIVCGLPLMINAQEAFDVLHMSQTELRGTSRFQSMAGAFGALGGDLSTLTQNPAGIAVYRNSDLGVTFSLDFNSTKAGNATLNETKFNVNNVGYVGAIRLDSESVPNLNFGFSYNRLQSFNRHYSGGVSDLETSLSNYIASEFCNAYGYGHDDLYWTDDYDPYNQHPYCPWSAITTYDMKTNNGGYVGIINVEPYGMDGLYRKGTTGVAGYEVNERGHADEYNIAFGGNIANKVYLGLDFGILDLDYRSDMYYDEELDNAYIMADDENLLTSPIINDNTRANWGMYNYRHTEGTGVNFKLGLIWRPTQALRIGAAFHTPTYYDMRSTIFQSAYLNAYQNNVQLYRAEKTSNDGYDYSSTYTMKTPWHFLGSVAGVIGTKGIISLDYEYVANETMRLGNDRNVDYSDVTQRVKEYFKPSHIIRIGGEYRVTKEVSLRAGYSYQSSPVKKDVREDKVDVMVSGSCPAYSFDKSVQYFTAGIGYHNAAGFYADLAYVHKNRANEYRAVPANFAYPDSPLPAIGNSVTDNNNRISLTLGMRF